MKSDNRKKKMIYVLLLVVLVVAGIALFAGRSKSSDNEQEGLEPGEQLSEEEDTGEKVKHEAPATYQAGSVDGNHYESEWLGIQFDAPKNFHMYSAKELKNRLTEAEEQERESLTSDMYATSEDMGSVEIHVEKKGSVTSAKEYLEAQQQEVLANAGDVMKFKNVGSISKETIAGQEYDCLKLEYTLDGMEICSERYARIVDECVVLIQIDYDPSASADRDAAIEAFKAL